MNNQPPFVPAPPSGNSQMHNNPSVPPPAPAGKSFDGQNSHQLAPTERFPAIVPAPTNNNQQTAFGVPQPATKKPGFSGKLVTIIAGSTAMLLIGALACLGIVGLTQSSGPVASGFCRDHLAFQQVQAEIGELYGIGAIGYGLMYYDYGKSSSSRSSSRYGNSYGSSYGSHSNYSSYDDSYSKFSKDTKDYLFQQYEIGKTLVEKKLLPVTRRLAQSANKSKAYYKSLADSLEYLLKKSPESFTSYDSSTRFMDELVDIFKKNDFKAIELEKGLIEDLEACEIK